MKRTGKTALIALISLIAIIGTGAYTVHHITHSSAGGFGKGKRGPNGDTVFSVKTQVIQKQTLHAYVIANGEIESQNSVSVFPDKAGKIISTEVMLGSTVKRGDIIAYVDPSQPGERYQKSPVYAPISGSIISTPLKNGTTVTTSKEITQIGDITNLQVAADIPERYVSVLKTGLKAFVTVEAYPDVQFAATVIRVSPVVDATSRTKQIILSFDKKDSRVNAGMFGKVILFTEDYTGELTMPLDSLIEKDDIYYAFVIKPDMTAERRQVTLGKSVDGITQILSGLYEGETVVTQGQTTLSEGAKVRDITNSSAGSNNSNGVKK